MTIYAKAELLYSQNGILAFPTFILNRATAQLKRDSEQRFQIAEGFYLGASDCLCNWAQYSVCVFMLHHAVEQLCIGLIEVCLGYHAEFGNLNRLLNLCCCFSQEPLQLFTATTEDRRLFQILTKSYSALRYQADFAVSEKDATSLCDKVSDFMAMVTRLVTENDGAIDISSLRSLDTNGEKVRSI